MTQHVRTGYRGHREAVWGLALLLVAAIAAVAIPFASGAPSKVLKFDPQPPVAMQKSGTVLPTAFSVAVFQGGQTMNSQGQTPTLITTGAGTILDNFTVSGPTYSDATQHWTWQVTPKPTAVSGFYTFTATLGNLDPATATVRVAEFVCPPSCDNASSLNTRAPGRLRIADFGSPVALDFQLGLGSVPDGCNNTSQGTTWHRTFIDVNGNGDQDDSDTYFPAVALDFNYGNVKMLQVTYMIRNSDYVLTEAARGNNDIELCAVARHQTAAWNGDGADPRPFDGKYGPSQWDGTHYSGVLKSVSNPSKVKTDGTGSPATCGRGNTVISGETWRTQLVCIPFDWDWSMG